MKTIDKEKAAFSIFCALLFFSIISGVLASTNLATTSIKQMILLAHSAIGIILIYFAVKYTIIHFRRTIGIRKVWASITGMLTLIVTAAYSSFSLYYLLPPTKALITLLHQKGYLLLITLTTIHYLTAISKNKIGKIKKTYTPSSLLQATKITTLVIFILTPIIFALNHFTPTADEAFTHVTDYNYNYGDNPFWPSQTTTPSQNFIAENYIGNSLKCASCHQEIYQQWQSSAHKHAADDPAYVTNINLLANNKGIEATRYCEGCHAPIALLSGRLTSGGKHGGISGTMGNSEGVSCLSCHNIQSVNNLNGVGSYNYTPHKPYLFEQAKSRALQKIHNWIVKASPSQHILDMGRPALRTAKHCSTCHTQFMDKELNNWGWVKMQDEYAAWSQSAYSGNNDQSYSNQKKTLCQDCHMPLEESSDPSANSDGLIRSHRFIGANTMLATINNDQIQLNKTIEFLRRNKLKVTIEKPHRKSAVQASETINESIRNPNEGPHYHYIGENIQFSIAVSNIGVGHNFPGGTADINEPWLEVKATDASGETVYHSGFIDSEGYVDPSAHKYVSRPVDRHGNEVWKHDLFNMIGNTYKNTIAAGSTDIVAYSFDIPTWAKSPLLITATLKYRKLNNKYAKWALKEKYTKLPIVDMSIDSISIPLKIENPVIQ